MTMLAGPHLSDADFILRRLATAACAILVAVVARVVLPAVRRSRGK